MKPLGVIFSMVASMSMSHAEGSSDAIPDLLKKIGHASATGSEEQAIAIMRDLEAEAVWSFGAGLGPTTNDSLRVRAVVFTWPTLSKAIKSRKAVVLPGSLSKFKAFANGDEIELGVALASPDPAIRMAGLMVVETLKKLPPQIVASLEEITKDDPFFQIVRVPIEPKDKTRPQPTDQFNQAVSAPLRICAKKELTKRGLGKDLQSEVDDREAAKWLATMLLNEKLNFDDVRAAVTSLDDAEGVLGELRASAKTQDKEHIMRDAARLSKPKAE
jgi:hypothetical protein